jgi:Domain of unknown function (DUF4318)
MRPLHPSTEVGRIFFLFNPYGTDEYGRMDDKVRNHLFMQRRTSIMKNVWKKLMKKGFSVELDQLPQNKQQFLDEIERYCVQEKVNYKFIEYDRPAVISIDDVVYKCQVENAGRPGFVLHFKEV